MAEIIGENEDNFKRSGKFQQWLRRFDEKTARIQSVEEGWSLWRGQNKDELVFALLFVRCLDEEGRERRSVVFFRGNASAVFLVVKNRSTKEKYAVLVEQLRIPSGGKLLEIPAGSAEENDDPLERIVREVQEEVGLLISARDFNFLGSYYFSPGACDEKISLYSCEVVLCNKDIQKLEGSLTGTPGEHTKVRLYRLEGFGMLPIYDAKTILAYELYRKGRKAK